MFFGMDSLNRYALSGLIAVNLTGCSEAEFIFSFIFPSLCIFQYLRTFLWRREMSYQTYDAGKKSFWMILKWVTVQWWCFYLFQQQKVIGSRCWTMIYMLALNLSSIILCMICFAYSYVHVGKILLTVHHLINGQLKWCYIHFNHITQP